MDLSSYVSDGQYRYYYAQLDKKRQTAYTDLLNGYLEQRSCLFIRVDNMDDIWDIHRAVCYDVPELFYIKNVRASFNNILHTATVYPEYRFNEETRRNILEQMEKTSQMLIGRISMLSESEKVKQLHDYLIRLVTYKDVEAPYSHEAPGTLLYGIGVCEGIAKAFKYLADRVHIESLVAVGKCDNDENAQEGMGHAWNVVYVDGCPYHLDVTFDYSISSNEIVRYDYYLLSDSQIQADHTYTNLPTCNNSIEYYDQVGCLVVNKKTLQRLVAKELRPGSTLVFRIPSLFGDKNEIVDVVSKSIVDAVPLPYAVGHSISLSYNMPRMIFQVQLI